MSFTTKIDNDGRCPCCGRQMKLEFQPNDPNRGYNTESVGDAENTKNMVGIAETARCTTAGGTMT